MLDIQPARSFSFGDKRRAYYVTNSPHSRGAGRSGKHNRYFLNRVIFSYQTSVRIKLTGKDMEELQAAQTDLAKMGFCDQLIAQKLCQGCRLIPPTDDGISNRHLEQENR